MAIRASGAGPPYSPLCLGSVRVRSDTMTSAVPRNAVVNVGTPGSMLPMSAITIASQANSSGCSAGYASKGLPHSS